MTSPHRSPSTCDARSTRRNLRFAAIGAFAALVLGGCGSTGGMFGGGPSAGGESSMSQRFAQLFSSNSQTNATATPVAGAPNQNVDCPTVEVRQGTSTYSISAAGADAGALGLRYQATIGQTARECAALGATMTIKLGVQGRIILGPAGGPGQVEVPMRFALVQEGPAPKTIWTKFYKIPVTIGPGQSNIPFVYVEEDLTFPMPKPTDLEAYVIYVGFDPLGMQQQTRPQRRR